MPEAEGELTGYRVEVTNNQYGRLQVTKSEAGTRALAIMAKEPVENGQWCRKLGHLPPSVGV